MVDTNQNPLAKHFRQPSIYIKLPSGGKYWAEGSVELPLNGELPVYPMTTKDELTLRTPDALMSGQGVVSVIQSCCPNVKNAWDAPSIDMDTLLIAIRIASYGHDMDVDSLCAKCQEPNRFTIDLRSALDSIIPPDYNTPLQVGELRIKLKPQEYTETSKANAMGYEEQRMVANITESTLDAEEKSRAIAAQMAKLIDMTTDLLAKSTAYIALSEGDVVSDQNFIKEFYANAPSTVSRAIQEKVGQMATDAAIKPYQVKCTSCEAEYSMSVDFDYASFFDAGF